MFIFYIKIFSTIHQSKRGKNMLKIGSVFNLAMGFTPYQAGKQIGWIKENQLNSRFKNVYKHLPSGTIVKQHIDTRDGSVCRKSVLKPDGTEIKSYRSNHQGGRTIYVRRPDKTGIVARTKHAYDFKNEKYCSDIRRQVQIQKPLFSAMKTLKMRLGIE